MTICENRIEKMLRPVSGSGDGSLCSKYLKMIDMEHF